MRHFILFFFKQKTAYEMRISDWSSDVCSSDLRSCRCHPAIAALERALQLQDDIGKIGAEQYQQILDNERAQLRVNDALEARSRITSLILGQAQEIGRASCRERVCQYV